MFLLRFSDVKIKHKIFIVSQQLFFFFLVKLVPHQGLNQAHSIESTSPKQWTARELPTL